MSLVCLFPVRNVFYFLSGMSLIKLMCPSISCFLTGVFLSVPFCFLFSDRGVCGVPFYFLFTDRRVWTMPFYFLFFLHVRVPFCFLVSDMRVCAILFSGSLLEGMSHAFSLCLSLISWFLIQGSKPFISFSWQRGSVPFFCFIHLSWQLTWGSVPFFCFYSWQWH